MNRVTSRTESSDKRYINFKYIIALDCELTFRFSGKRKIIFRTSLRNTVLDVLENQDGWAETDSEHDWDFYWADVGWIRENLGSSTPLQDHQVGIEYI
jgi:hypothetical protein